MGLRRLRIIDGSVDAVEKPAAADDGAERLSDVRFVDGLRIKTQAEVKESLGDNLSKEEQWMLEQMELHGEEEVGTVVGAISSQVFIAPEGCDFEDVSQLVTYFRRPAQVCAKITISLVQGSKVLFRRRKAKNLERTSFLVRALPFDAE